MKVNMDFKVGEYFYSLKNIETGHCRKIGTIHKILLIVVEPIHIHYKAIKDETWTDDLLSIRKATEVEIVIAKLLGKCYE